MTEMKIGQIWESLDPREGPVQKRVTAINDGLATMQGVTGGRMTRVNCEKFLKRSGTNSGYKLVCDA